MERAFRESVDDYLDFCRERGEEPDKPCSGQFMVRVGSDLHRKAAAVASAAGQSLNAWVAGSLAREVERLVLRAARTRRERRARKVLKG